MIRQLLRRWAGSPDEVARKVQAVGLIRTAQLASGVLGVPAPKPRAMPEWIEEVLRAVMDRLCRYDDGDMPAPSGCGALAASREFLESMPDSTEREFQSLLVLIEVAPYVFGPKRKRFTELAGDDQDEALRGWEQSALVPRMAGFNAIKSVVMMGYWTRPETWPAIGYSVVENPGVNEPQRQMWEKIEEGL